jgi:hypothetical protein
VTSHTLGFDQRFTMEVPGPAVAARECWRSRDSDVGDTEGMRKQYHFWPGEHGLDAWDVDRLIELSRDLPVQEVELGDIWEIDTVYWFDGREQPTVRKVVEHARLIEEVDLSYPIILGSDGRVMDGMHRVARALLEGRSSIGAVRLTEHPEPDYRNVRPEDLPY